MNRTVASAAALVTGLPPNVENVSDGYESAISALAIVHPMGDPFAMPFADLIFTAQTIHRTYFDPNKVQKAELLSIKTGGCPEDCGYCNQSAKFDTGLKATKLMDIESVIAEARAARRGLWQGTFQTPEAWRNANRAGLMQAEDD